jgi:hypothetical protein
MALFDFSADMIRTAQQIYHLKQRIRAVDPRERSHLQRKLKELEILQRWQCEKKASDEINP